MKKKWIRFFERNCLAINKLIDKIVKLYNVKQATELGKKVEQDFFGKKNNIWLSRFVLTSKKDGPFFEYGPADLGGASIFS